MPAVSATASIEVQSKPRSMNSFVATSSKRASRRTASSRVGRPPAPRRLVRCRASILLLVTHNSPCQLGRVGLYKRYSIVLYLATGMKLFVKLVLKQGGYRHRVRGQFQRPATPQTNSSRIGARSRCRRLTAQRRD